MGATLLKMNAERLSMLTSLSVGGPEEVMAPSEEVTTHPQSQVICLQAQACLDFIRNGVIG